MTPASAPQSARRARFASPRAHRSSSAVGARSYKNGTVNADLIIFVTARPISQDGVLAFARLRSIVDRMHDG